jgi:DEAD/DEAH box helicase domain-containing protein
MLPSIVATELRHCVADYLRTTFRPTTPGFDSLMDRFLGEPSNVGRGPYVSIGLPFRSGTIGANYFRDIPMPFSPHLHQERAFARLSPPYYQSTLIATGTGSGKTECFLFPILEHCRQHAGEPGIKAILIYPMNALATDQSKRIADLINNNPALQGKVTAGLYVGDSDETPTAVMGADKVITDKRIIRESPPDILLTNYKMLDYLLLQPDTQALWRDNQSDTLRYIVVDEFHTFDGAQGTDLACLLRRLKYRLNTPPQYLACIGTSATLGGNNSRDEMLKYAATIFQEPFLDGGVIEEDRLTASEFLQEALLNVLPLPGPEQIDQLRPDGYTTPEAYIRTQARLWLLTNCPVEAPSGISLSDDWLIRLGEELKTLPIIQILIRMLGNHPHSYDELLEQLSRRLYFPPSNDSDYRYCLLDSLFSLISAARCRVERPDSESATSVLPWITLRSQLWFRELKRMVATVETHPKLLFSDDLTQDQLKKTLPIVHCRDCGATGWAGVRPSQDAKRLSDNDLQRFYREFFGRNPNVSFLFPTDEPRPDDKKLCPKCFALNGPNVDRCQSCNHNELILVFVPDNTRPDTQNGQKSVVSHSDCPVCSSSSGLSILGAQAASLTSAMIGVLFTTPFNPDKKLLTFSDSVQDAAHRAGFYAARTYRTTLRTAIAHTVRTAESGSLTLQALIEQFPPYWQHQLGSTANYVATFLPNDLEWLREWAEFVQSDRTNLPADSRLPDLVNERLVWEIVNQFGHRAAVGPSLERSATCATSFNPKQLEQAVNQLHLKLTNEVEPLRQIQPDLIRQSLLGLLHHLRQRGGILQPATQIYIKQGGNTFLLQKPLYMPRMGPRIPTPIFLVDAPAKSERFERILQSGQRNSWCEDWMRRVFGSASLLLKEQIEEILNTTLNTLVESGLLEVHPCNQGQAWGIPLSMIYLHTSGTVFVCDRCSHQVTASDIEQASLEGMACLNLGCSGHYHPDQRAELAYYRQLYQTGEVRRIMAAEHTGLLTRPNRERLEHRFIQGDRRCDPNLLSATSTLEMGINIGDLSTVVLCSVPPTPANFQQRIGRAGRRDGNALVSTVANGSSHDLFFYADPMRMLSGSIEAAGCYLDASAVLQRQLTAFCLDNWVRTDITRREFPNKLGDVLNAMEPRNLESQYTERFPHNWLAFIQLRQSELLESFLRLFEDTIEDYTRQQLRLFMEQGEQDEGGLRWRILNRLEGVRQERTRLGSQIKTLTSKIKKLKDEPESLQDSEQMEELERERMGFRGLLRDLNDKQILNFLTDEGLLPNYAFPEAGVTLRSILWRKSTQADQGNGKRYDTFTLTYERPGTLAIRELVPSGVFYAEGRRVKIDQIDLKLSEPEDWRICRSCNYSVRAIQPEAHEKTCPRCGDTMWSDQGRVRRMLRLRQVMANTSDKDSRFGDDSEDRSPSFFQRHLLVDFEPEYRDKTFLVQDKEFPFGFEFISCTGLREVNLGESLSIGEKVDIGGKHFTTQGFRVCRSCGKVMRVDSTKDSSKDHTISCQWRNKPEQAKALEVLYLYREFESEAIRLLMPDEKFWTSQGLHSFIAALQLGLKRKFGGKVDHLRTVICEEPQRDSSLRKSFLYLYDSVPGGTGYLRQLIRNPDELLDIFSRALSVLRACDCKDGCYNCLFAYRGHFDQDETSRRTAVELLASIVQHWPQLKETSTGLSAIRLNRNFESELERRFIEAIQRYSGKVYEGAPPILRKDIINGRAGYYLKIGETSWTIETQVTLSHQDGVKIPSRADFVLRPASSKSPSRPVVIFTDGWEFHRERINKDFQQRLAILRSGQFLCWSLTWDDVAAQLESDFQSHPLNGLTCQLNPQVEQKQHQVTQQYQCLSMQGHEALGSFEWLMSYLAQPDAALWQKWALLRTLAQINPQSLTDASLTNRWQRETSTILEQEALDLWEIPDKYLCGEVSISPFLKIWSAVDRKRHQVLDSEGSLVLLQLDDLPHQEMKDLKHSWVEVLRLLNLYQFLPHVYAVTTTATEQGNQSLLAQPTRTSMKASNTSEETEWEQICQLVEERLLPSLDRMRQEFWPLPEVGYELGDNSGSVIADAELAWIDQRIAIVLTLEDQIAFSKNGWKVFNLDEFLHSMDDLRTMLQGDT